MSIKDEAIDILVTLLNVPKNILEEINANEGHREILEKIVTYVTSTQEELELYQATLQEYSDTLEGREEEISKSCSKRKIE